MRTKNAAARPLHQATPASAKAASKTASQLGKTSLRTGALASEAPKWQPKTALRGTNKATRTASLESLDISTLSREKRTTTVSWNEPYWYSGPGFRSIKGETEYSTPVELLGKGAWRDTRTNEVHQQSQPGADLQGRLSESNRVAVAEAGLKAKAFIKKSGASEWEHLPPEIRTVRLAVPTDFHTHRLEDNGWQPNALDVSGVHEFTAQGRVGQMISDTQSYSAYEIADSLQHFTDGIEAALKKHGKSKGTLPTYTLSPERFTQRLVSDEPVTPTPKDIAGVERRTKWAVNRLGLDELRTHDGSKSSPLTKSWSNKKPEGFDREILLSDPMQLLAYKTGFKAHVKDGDQVVFSHATKDGTRYSRPQPLESAEAAQNLERFGAFMAESRPTYDAEGNIAQVVPSSVELVSVTSKAPSNVGLGPTAEVPSFPQGTVVRFAPSTERGQWSMTASVGGKKYTLPVRWLEQQFPGMTEIAQVYRHRP